MLTSIRYNQEKVIIHIISIQGMKKLLVRIMAGDMQKSFKIESEVNYLDGE